MRIELHKVSDRRHRVVVTRDDGSTDAVELESKDFLRHDLAHLAVELELGLRDAVWGSVAAGGSLDGTGLDGSDLPLAERLAGPMQTLMRTAAAVDEIQEVLLRLVPDRADAALAERLHGRIRALSGHWAATDYGDVMVVEWPHAPASDVR